MRWQGAKLYGRDFNYNEEELKLSSTNKDLLTVK